MKNKQNFIFKRQQEILKYLKKNKFAKTEDLAKLLNTSAITIRRDFQILESTGIIERSYGGAYLVENALIEDPFFEKNTDSKIKIKEAIAKKAASFINDGDSIFINSSSTAMKILDYLENKHVIIITNNGNIFNSNFPKNIELISTGGEIYGKKKAMVGDIALSTLSKIKVNKCFIGVSGITSSSGLSSAALQETAINLKMLNNCNETFIVTAPSKIGHSHNFFSGDISLVNNLITTKPNIDEINSMEEIKNLQNLGINVVITDI